VRFGILRKGWAVATSYPLTDRSRDNFPNPKVCGDNPYVPFNSPAIDDLFDMFQLKHH